MRWVRGTIRSFQHAIRRWADSCLTGTIHEPDLRILAYRVLEEANELAQAAGLSEEDAIRQVRYTFARPAGTVREELPQVLVNLAYMAVGAEEDLQDLSLAELERISTPEIKAKIFAKQQFKKDNGLL